METTRNKYYILNFVFLVCVLLLFLNDHYLKFEFKNWLTGKLSDVVGIVILPLLLAYLFPKLKLYVLLVSAVLFTFWKSHLSQGLIDTYNKYAFIQTSRVVDYTDLYVLLLLPIPYFIITRIKSLNCIKIHKINPLLLLIPTTLVLMATSPPPSHYYTRSEGNLRCYKCNITVNHNQDEIVEKLRKLDIIFDSIATVDTLALKRVPGLKDENVHTYRLNQLIIDKDTLKNLDFTMRTVKNRKTKIYFNGMLVSDDISTFKVERHLRNYYKKLLFKELKDKLK